ncbi:M56 family metallopeptidase [Flagellimonas aequoris]|uniref:TonB family protein n=1 Tax=Flagellimonas aequoris TaxID=2306997 RepID=A0A418NC88_9FLAO|nr:M56 family metallopeptidase [Allomuricauda aequoris]RIV73677.1 TonB family protein [Allomuricauda aequoris]TXK07361.1 TonB family protein [Allomuricauda aequoris]
MITYILETLAFQLVFLLTYDLFLKKETFFQWNRLYLLTTFVLSLVLPWVKFEMLKTTMPQELGNVTIFLTQLDGVVLTPEGVETSFWSSIPWYYGVLAFGSILSILWFAHKLHQIGRLKRSGTIQQFPEYDKIIVKSSTLAFSFFRNIFLGTEIQKEKEANIIAHELVHVKQRHTLDLLFFELARIVFWFNPLTYVYQNRMAELHEFIADAQVVKDNKREHFEMLLSEAFKTQHISFVNQFFNKSLIKKRIVMLQKKRSKAVWQLKYVLLLPLILGMLVYTSCETGKEENTEEIDSSVSLKAIEEVPFAVVDEVPVFPGCEDAEDKRACFNEKIQEHIRKNFHYPEAAQEQGIQGRVSTIFRIDPKGNIVDIKMRGPHELLEKETERILAKLPQMKPGKQNGEPVKVPFSIPITFKLQDNNEDIPSNKRNEEMIPFATIDEVPVFPGCENASDRKACFYESMRNHIRKHFNYPQEAQEQGIQGRVAIMFTINGEGEIVDIKKRGPSPLLEAEAERIIKRLPKMIPGKQDGKIVKVPFSIPITFKLQSQTNEMSSNKPKDYMQVNGGLLTENGSTYFKGTVMDSESMGLPGVNISIQGTEKGAVSDFDGYFSLAVAENDVLKFQYLGLPNKLIRVSH